ncbi:MAG: zinc-ribbon domain-containing protein [Candidatus Lokiarchaeota archaeon]|nr:zinc-ribbon domain-containing protein [Candidatus Lokiarchaeota archaeon]
MKEPVYKIIVGMVLVFIGLSILLLSNVTEFETFYFIFPFFFIGSGSDIGVWVFLLVVGLMVWLLLGGFSRIGNYPHKTTQDGSIYLRTDKKCDNCGSAIPTNASFCQVCGSPVLPE